MKIILQSMTSGGSGYGVSFWKSWMGCPKKAQRMEDDVERRRAKGLPPPLPTSEPLLTGTIVHALLEMYYRNPAKGWAADTKAISYMDDTGDPLDVLASSRLEAERIFRRYRAVYPPEELGKVLAVEVVLGGAHLERLLECTPFTTKPDLAVRLTKADCKRLKKTRHVTVKPGVWLVDHKTDSMTREWRYRAYLDEIQFTGQMLAWWLNYGEKPQGLLVNVLGKGRSSQFETLPVPFPTEEKIQVLRSFLAEAQYRRNGPNGRYDVTQCYNWSPCQYLKTCSRGAK